MVDASANNDDIEVPYQYANLPVWANTAVAHLTPSSSPVVLGTNLGSLSSLQSRQNGFGTLGYEWDVDADNGFRPAGEIDMSSTTDTDTSAFVEDYGTNVTNNDTTETHHLTLYRATSGALVFDAGTVQFSWGLDNWNPIRAGHWPGGSEHAAVRRQPLCHDGRAAGHSHLRTRPRVRVVEQHPSNLTDHQSDKQCDDPRWSPRHDYRDGD